MEGLLSAAQVVAAAGDNDFTALLAGECAARNVVLLNAGSRANDLRRQRCSRFVFHVAASDAMYEAALGSSPAGGRAMMWHSSLEKYGAAQLNDRYRARWGTAMGENAWAAWFAVKVAWEAFLRSPSGTAPEIARYLAADAAPFDGHKGAPLSFRSWDHQLRQPMYIVDSKGEVMAELPDTGRSTKPVRELLDTIGDSAGTSSCSGSAS
jgi:ABC-type branched-subunit amino acid transport system substrate-binding protein